MGFFVMIAVGLVVFFILKGIIGTLVAAILSIALLGGWFMLNIRSSTTGLIKANMRSYFLSRTKGATHEEAFEKVIWSRYPFSEEKPAAVKSMFEDYKKFLAENLEGKVQQTDEEELKSLVYFIFCYEQGDPPTSDLKDQIFRIIDDVYDSMSRRYGFTS